MKSITMFTTEPCAYCRSAKALLSKRGFEYEEINLSRDPDGRAELARRTGLMTFPQIIIDGEPLGGFSELAQAEQSGRLDELLAA